MGTYNVWSDPVLLWSVGAVLFIGSIALYKVVKLDRAESHKAPCGRKLTKEVIEEYREVNDYNNQSVFDETK